MTLDDLLSVNPYVYPQAEKEAFLLPVFRELTQYHSARCPEYAKIVNLTNPNYEKASALTDLPYLPASLFKTHKLQSVADQAIRVRMTSSGTSGKASSRIVADSITAKNQSRALAAIMRGVIGPTRLPILIIDNKTILDEHQQLNARAVGILGMMTFGQNPVFALDAGMNLQKDIVKDFLRQHGDRPFLMFGFTFMVWQYFYQQIQGQDFDCSHGILIHGGGWKKLEAESVDNQIFRAQLKTRCGLTRIHNYYGMIEQPGMIFMEGSDNFLYPPAFGDVIIRDPLTWQALPPGQPGIIQVLSIVPRSYPGHSILTEDMGIIMHIDGNKEWKGRALKVLGRAPKAELRGCSDVHAFGTSL